MISVFWNSRGVTAPGRKNFIDDNIVPLKVDYIGIQETKKDQFSNSFLKNLLGNRDFAWIFLPSVGSTGGILVGVNCEVFEILSWEIKTFSFSIVVRDKKIDRVCRITTVYGPAYADRKQEFISELHELYLD